MRKELINLKHKNKAITSETISKFQKLDTYKVDKVKNIIKSAVPQVEIDDILKEDEDEKKKKENLSNTRD